MADLIDHSGKTLILSQWKPALAYLPIETVIRDALADFSATDQVKALLATLGNETLSAFQLTERLGLSPRPTFRENYLNPALKAGLIECTISDQPKSRAQKDRKFNQQSPSKWTTSQAKISLVVCRVR